MAEKKNGLFSKIESADDARATIRGASSAAFFVAAMDIVLGALLVPSIIFDGIVLAILGAILRSAQSRVAATLLLIFCGAEAIITFLNRLSVTHQGGGNIYLAIIMVIAAMRAVEATFKLHGTFRETPTPSSKRPAQTRSAA